ncbi:MAG: hypothetical protein CSA38_01330 [Flavobacteriales bacterium]|nr:MAG: hypothetical protein CSA38_01330 [Flavobacteriales bacterium]
MDDVYLINNRYLCRIKRYNYIQAFFSRTHFLYVLVAFFCFNVTLLQANDAKGGKGKSGDKIHLVGGARIIENKTSPKLKPSKPKRLIPLKKKIKPPVIKHHNTTYVIRNSESTSFYSVMGKTYNKVANHVQVLLLFLYGQLGLLFLFVLVKKTGEKYIDVFTSRRITYSLYSRPPTFIHNLS